ncbi:hypothetical protein CMV52_08915 [Klebsiella pneumoniae]|nr:hypothetical protein CMV62_13245 [Klebsiella pneumoniae]RJK73254.1 hypothetical protein CMV52_08915 [Klebsiella pneumoniae]
MMQMFKYPQGEGGRSGRIGCQPATAYRSVLPFYLCLTPLLSRFVTRTLGPQTVNSKGGYGRWLLILRRITPLRRADRVCVNPSNSGKW